MSFRPLASNSPILRGFETPELMAIGDSIFNGVRSLTIDRRLASSSPPAFVARGLGLPMVQPDYPDPILVDLEQELRDGIDFDRIRTHVIANAERWLAKGGRWSQHRFFDNISVAGFRYSDIFDARPEGARPDIGRLLAAIKQTPKLDFGLAAELYMALNTTFVLNPTGAPELEGLSQLEHVASRQPKRLLINIGNNEGLFGIGINARFDPKFVDSIRSIPFLAEALATALKMHCPKVGKIYFNLLLRPRALANLSPVRDSDMDVPPKHGYYHRYVGRLGTQHGLLADEMKAFDNEIAKVNAQTREKMTAVFGPDEDKLVFVDLYNMVDGFDAKHFGLNRRIPVKTGDKTWHIGNYPFSVLFGELRQGGLFGLDNMHPTTVGYALLANTMGKAIAKAEPTLKYRSVDMAKTVLNDTLIQNPPAAWDRLNLLAGFFGPFAAAALR